MAGTACLAETLRIATWHVDLERDGPGLLLRDILKGEDRDIAAAVAAIADAAPDILLLTGFDWDDGGAALGAFADRLSAAGMPFPHSFAARPNAGLPSGADLDGDGRLGGPRDAQGYGRFAGQGGMALLSKLPLARSDARDFTDLKWTELPGAMLPETEAGPFPSKQALAVQRLSSVGHWDMPVILRDGSALHVLGFAAGPPVFDGPEDRNGKRNHDEIALWSRYLAGGLGLDAPEAPVVVLGRANLDPHDGEGLRRAIAQLAAHPRLQDPAPRSPRGMEISQAQGGANAAQRGDPALDTADFGDDPGPGNLRTQYVLPDRALRVTGSGIAWAEDHRHGLVWVDIDLPTAADQPAGTFSASQARTARK